MSLELLMPEELVNGGVVIWLIIGLAVFCYGLILEGYYLLFFKRDREWLSEWIKPLQIMISAIPLLGLLGTIIGLLDIFRAISLQQNQSMSDGIAKALLTTQMGLLMAIPAILMLWFLQTRLTQGETHAA